MKETKFDLNNDDYIFLAIRLGNLPVSIEWYFIHLDYQPH